MNVTLANGGVQNIVAPENPLIGTGASPFTKKNSPIAAVQVFLDANIGQATTATIIVEVSNDGKNPAATVAATISLSGSGTGNTPVSYNVISAPPPACAASDGFTFQNAGWAWVRINITALTGTGAKVWALLGT